MSSNLLIPTPTRLYIHDDLGECRSELFPLIKRLRDLLKENKHVILLNKNEQIKIVRSELKNKKFKHIFAVGRAAESLAYQIFTRKSELVVHCLEVCRRERVDGSYTIINSTSPKVKKLIASLTSESVAIIEDTIYSGKTLETILSIFSVEARANVTIVCLQASQAGVLSLDCSMPVIAATLLPGRIDSEISIIKATGLFTSGAIRGEDGVNKAFFQRPEWLKAWFPQNFQSIYELCQHIYNSLEEDSELLELLPSSPFKGVML